MMNYATMIQNIHTVEPLIMKVEIVSMVGQWNRYNAYGHKILAMGGPYPNPNYHKKEIMASLSSPKLVWLTLYVILK